jgi:hypothetical protein
VGLCRGVPRGVSVGVCAVTDSEPNPSRRAFLLGAARAGTAAAALTWVAPKLSSTAFAADAAGSPPPGGPGPVETGVGPQRAPEQGPAAPPGPAGGPAPAAAPSGQLPFTGSNSRPLLVGGTAAVIGGAVMTQAARNPVRPEEATTT